MAVDKKQYDLPGHTDIAWCPGCGNFPILNIVKMALAELNLPPEAVVMCSGIGQAAKTPQYMRVNYFNGLHGRALPVATAIKLAHPEMTVISESGDGDTYGEGGNHFLHAIRRNPDITNIVHDNMVYGLTKGQASPTSEPGMVTSIQTEGVLLEPFNPLATAITLGATFVGRVFSGDILQAKEIVKQAILHKGYALVDVFQPCVVYNKQNTYQWFKSNTYYLDESYDKTDKKMALEKAFDIERMALGVIYEEKGKLDYGTRLGSSSEPLFKHQRNDQALQKLIQSYQ
jgi:2-oxoglutarate ferredoxin oxidoreductase subunit beta